tara:strand:+ start:2553 stop:4733 length:2181 start_codon:yes stop_codon:yes gene_type:complete
MKINNLLSITILVSSLTATSQVPMEKLVKVFEGVDTMTVNEGTILFSDDYTETGSEWFVTDSFPETTVFQKELLYISNIDTNQSYRMRIGKGGQIYSLRGVFGESIPPQWRWEPADPEWYGRYFAPWVDEVWQMVAVDLAKNILPDSLYFVHQSGVYLHDSTQNSPFYSPMVAYHTDTIDQSYSIVNWGQHAHTKSVNNSNYTSSIMYYTKYKNLGGGVIQVDYFIYNFGNDNLGYLNIPWGGVRDSNLDHMFIARADNTLELMAGGWGIAPIVEADTTGGWAAFSSDIEVGSPTLGLVIGKENNGRTYKSRFRQGSTGAARNYNVFTSPKILIGEERISFGESIRFRTFMVFGANGDSVRNIIESRQLVEQTIDTTYITTYEEAEDLNYQFYNSELGIEIEQVDIVESGFLLKAQPFENSYPVFRLRTNDAEEKITSNLYTYSNRPYDGIVTDVQLLGFNNQPVNLHFESDTVCLETEYLFPDGSSAPILMDNTVQISTFDLDDLPDSVVYSSVYLYPQWVDTFDLSICKGDTITFGLGTYTSSNEGIVTEVFTDINGCDSILTLLLDVHEVDTVVSVIEQTLEASATGEFYQWINCDNGEIVAEGESAIFTVIEPGAYAVVISDGICTDTSTCFSFYDLSLDELNDYLLSIYPNPVIDHFTVDLSGEDGEYTIEILNSEMQKVIEKSGAVNEVLNVNFNQPSGMYFVKISINDNSYYNIIINQK